MKLSCLVTTFFLYKQGIYAYVKHTQTRIRTILGPENQEKTLQFYSEIQIHSKAEIMAYSNRTVELRALIQSSEGNNIIMAAQLLMRRKQRWTFSPIQRKQQS